MAPQVRPAVACATARSSGGGARRATRRAPARASLTRSPAIVYLLSSTIPGGAQPGRLCTWLGLAGIYFPVASFLYTDAIAVLLWRTVSAPHRRLNRRLFSIVTHVTCWLLPACVVLAVALAHKAGYTGDGRINTGGWCWISADGGSVLLWEVIGGKAIEWLSSIVLVPFFYYRVYRALLPAWSARRAARAGLTPRPGPPGGP